MVHNYLWVQSFNYQYQWYFHRTLPIAELCSFSTHSTWKPSCSGRVGRLMYGTRHPGPEPCNTTQTRERPPGWGEIRAYHHLSVLFIHLVSFKTVHQLPENTTWTNMYLSLSERNSKERLQFLFQIQSQKVHVLPQIPFWIFEMPSFLFKSDFWVAKFNALPAANHFTGWKFIQWDDDLIPQPQRDTTQHRLGLPRQQCLTGSPRRKLTGES